MSRKGRHIYPRGNRKLYLGEWLARFGKKPGDLAKEARTTPQYISEIISGKKPNPSIYLLLTISEILDITVNDLFRPPPPQAAFKGLSQSALVALGRHPAGIKPTLRK